MKKFLNKKLFPLGMMLFALVASCMFFLNYNGNETAVEDNEFNAKIELLNNDGSSHRRIQINTIDELVKDLGVNLIIRGKVVSREESGVFDYLGKFNNDDLYVLQDKGTEWQPNNFSLAHQFISTPYQIEILEVLMGNVNEVGEIINVLAPYGIVGEFELGSSGHPVYVVGDEYILFYRVEMIHGKLYYFLPYTPLNMLSVNHKNNSFERDHIVAREFYSKFDNSLTKLTEYIRETVQSERYELDITVIDNLNY